MANNTLAIMPGITWCVQDEQSNCIRVCQNFASCAGRDTIQIPPTSETDDTHPPQDAKIKLSLFLPEDTPRARLSSIQHIHSIHAVICVLAEMINYDGHCLTIVFVVCRCGS